MLSGCSVDLTRSTESDPDSLNVLTVKLFILVQVPIINRLHYLSSLTQSGEKQVFIGVICPESVGVEFGR